MTTSSTISLARGRPGDLGFKSSVQQYYLTHLLGDEAQASLAVIEKMMESLRLP